MTYKTEFQFFLKLLNNFHLNHYVFSNRLDKIPEFDKGLRQLFYPGIDYTKAFSHNLAAFRHNTIYRIHDEFLCSYLFLRLPKNHLCILAGPYLTAPCSAAALLEDRKMSPVPESLLSQLENFYTGIPLIRDEVLLLSIWNTFGECIWGSIDNFSLEDVSFLCTTEREPIALRPEHKQTEDALVSMRILEERYALENQFMQAVAQGQTHKAETFINSSFSRGLEHRIPDPVRNIKNYSIILNTLLRKAAEMGIVHPLHIDSLSSRFASKIEQLSSEAAGLALHKEMVHKYCLLVKNHSMKGYSLLVRKVLTRIDSDLTADLSLKAQADLLNVNPSYLSTLFKREMGCTLTEYVNRKRIEHGIFLLNSTGMQIQEIAQACGIPDLNYFTKTFKKLTGKTPKEYRDNISGFPNHRNKHILP